jgi:hypothetical protein
MQKPFQGANGLRVENSRMLSRQPAEIGHGVVGGDEIEVGIIQGRFGLVFQGVGVGVHKFGLSVR